MLSDEIYVNEDEILKIHIKLIDRTKLCIELQHDNSDPEIEDNDFTKHSILKNHFRLQKPRNSYDVYFDNIPENEHVYDMRTVGI